MRSEGFASNCITIYYTKPRIFPFARAFLCNFSVLPDKNMTCSGFQVEWFDYVGSGSDSPCLGGTILPTSQSYSILLLCYCEYHSKRWGVAWGDGFQGKGFDNFLIAHLLILASLKGVSMPQM
ncbi:hypothetical protein NE237_029504 [Protea cynaroides]|uniref:Uncharacterized protein n=1 Tax=Protea cynaroides TaxID=273540 RepID=A0A9Q0GRB7_9MAGN|nr:hypothetical protein NE237_029504 [Protea cynaroides]